MLRNRVLLVLAAASLLAAFGGAFLTHAPNRLLSGAPVSLLAAARETTGFLLFPGVLLLASPFAPQRPATHRTVAGLAAAVILALLWLAGAHAGLLAASAPEARTSLGAGFWILITCAALAMLDAARRLQLSALQGLALPAAMTAAIAGLYLSGALDALSIVREYADRRDVLADALVRHLMLVLGALLPASILGALIGVLAHRGRHGVWLFATLNAVQTIPSMALFALLLAPLAFLAAELPWLATLGISGIGPAPAIVALVLYSLLPIARNAAAGLAGVPHAVREAARGMGMSARQVFWRIEVPLALPVLLAGLRIGAVQAIGLAAVAALIGAGGLGAIMFQGLFANVADLTLLGALPVILLALAADALFRVLAAWAEGRPRD